jgi:hypothetical protein
MLNYLWDPMLHDPTLRAVEAFLRPTPMGVLMRTSQWAWPIFESLHFTGMSVLVGVVGLFDLRLLGFARGVPILALHRLIPLGVAGFLLNATTGLFFLCGTPDQYLFNLAFRWKVVFLLTAGVNVLVFYTATFKRLLDLAPGQAPPLGARLAGGVSLCAWVGVMAAGRLLTFFRP